MKIARFFLIFGLLTMQMASPHKAETSTRSPRVALTFDDGPRPVSTAKLQLLLWKHSVPATFFIVGKMAAKYPEIVQSLAKDGHEIANHTWSHPDIRRLSKKEIRSELDKTRQLIEILTGQKTYLFRAPGGTDAYWRTKFEVPLGYELVLWDVHSLDHEGGDADLIQERVLAQVKDGDIVLMHNGLEETMKALETIIPMLKEKGFEFVTVTELLRSRRHNEFYVQRPVSIRGEVWVR